MACSGNSRLPLEEESCTTRKDSSSSSASTSTNASVVEDGNGDSSRCPIPALHLPPKRDFYEIRKSCLNADVLYEDPEFPATDASLYFSRNPQKPVVWKRPWDLCLPNNIQPELFVGDGNQFHITQGELGDPWVVMAAACLLAHKDLLQQVIPCNQNFDKDSYAGIFQFRFWRYGQWQEVLIDDRLPTVQGHLAFVHSSQSNEFWAALLEKAYAKLLGSYEALQSGFITDVLHDLTGGLVQAFNFEERKPVREELTRAMFKALERRSLVFCFINSPVNPGSISSAPVLSNGLVTGRTYIITDLREIQIVSNDAEEPITLVRLRDPSGSKVKWSGAWSQSSSEWNSIPMYDKHAMGLTCCDPSEFWIQLSDFLRDFDLVGCCHLRPESTSESARKWSIKDCEGSWKCGLSAGGRPVYTDSHWVNPQFLLTLTTSDEDDGSVCSFFVQLEQKDRRRIKQRAMRQVDMGFVIYKRPKDVPLPLPKYFFEQHQFVARCDFFTNARQVLKSLALPPGDYVIMPCTYEAQVEADFVLTLFMENEQAFQFIDDPIEADSCPALPQSSDQSIREREQHFQKYFHEIAGEDMEINAFQFQQVINMGLRTGRNYKDVSLDACHSMLSLVDVSSSGKLRYHEFIYLWNIIKSWKKTFYQHAKGNSGTIDAHDLRDVVLSLGYRLNSSFLSRLVTRFANDQYQIELNSFISCMVKILTLFNVFRTHQKNGKAVFTLDQWLDLALVL